LYQIKNKGKARGKTVKIKKLEGFKKFLTTIKKYTAFFF